MTDVYSEIEQKISKAENFYKQGHYGQAIKKGEEAFLFIKKMPIVENFSDPITQYYLGTIRELLFICDADESLIAKIETYAKNLWRQGYLTELEENS